MVAKLLKKREPRPTFEPGERVIYVPLHAYGDRGHPDCERGRVSSVNKHHVFVKFDPRVARLGWEGTTAEACDPESLIKER